MEGIDLLSKVQPGEKGIILATVSIQGINSGTTTIRISNLKIDDAKGDIINPSICEGKIKINSEGNPINWTPPILESMTSETIVPLKTIEPPNTIDNPIGSNGGNNQQPVSTKSHLGLLGEPAQVRKIVDEVKNTPTSTLIEDNSQPHYSITQEFSVVNQERSVQSNLPLGSIISLSKNGTARVFDSTGKQILIADGDKAHELQTPRGLSRATQVFEVPNGAIITGKGNATFVIHDNKRILTIIRDNNTDKPALDLDGSFSPTDLMNDQWIEYDESDILSSVGNFEATWNVPINPNSISTQQSVVSSNMVWIGLQTPNAGGLLQPVLEWNMIDNLNDTGPGPGWTMAAWFVNSDTSPKISIHADRVTGPIAGQHVRGAMFNAGSFWDNYIYSTDNLSLAESFQFIDTDYFNSSNKQAEIVFEGWPESDPSFTSLDKNYLCGDTLMETISLKDYNELNINQNGIWHQNISPFWNVTKFQPLSVYNIGQWPTNRVILNTHEQNILIPLPGYSGLPTDPDLDGKYEDMNVNGRKDFNDVFVFFRQMSRIADNEPINPFDFNGNGRIDFDDIQLLLQEI